MTGLTPTFFTMQYFTVSIQLKIPQKKNPRNTWFLRFYMHFLVPNNYRFVNRNYRLLNCGARRAALRHIHPDAAECIDQTQYIGVVGDASDPRVE